MAEDHLENLWSRHGVTGSAHLGAGLMDQFASTHLLEDDWGTSLGNGALEDLFGQAAYYDPVINNDQFTVDPSLRQSFNLHNPFADDHLHFGDDDLVQPGEIDMDVADDAPASHEASPHSHSEEHESESAAVRRSISADSNATAAPSKTHTNEEDDEKANHSDHEDHNEDKSHGSKPSANNFVNKLHLMISDPSAAGFIWWTDLGTRYALCRLLPRTELKLPQLHCVECRRVQPIHSWSTLQA